MPSSDLTRRRRLRLCRVKTSCASRCRPITDLDPSKPCRRGSRRLVNTGSPFGAVAMAAAPQRAPGVGDLGEPAQTKPALEALAKLAWTIELDLARGNRAFHGEIAHEHARHRPQVGRNVEVDLEPRIGGAKIGLLAVAHEPPGAFRCRQIGKIELHAGPAGTKCIGLDASAHVPHEHGDVELITNIARSEPALAPFAQLADDRREFPPRLGEVVFRPLRPALAFDHADLLELLQSQAEQAARHQRNAAMQVAEMGAAAEQFAQHQRGPALSEDFGALGDRAKLTVTLHGHPPTSSDDTFRIEPHRPATSPNSVLDLGAATARIQSASSSASRKNRRATNCIAKTGKNLSDIRA